MTRWLLWLIVCRRGSRCANLVINEALIHDLGAPFEMPPGAAAVIDWRCGRCGTAYRTEGIFGNDGSVSQTTPERISS